MNWLFLVHLKPSRIVPVLLGGLWGLGVLPQPVRGQIAATDAGGLNTAVNGVVGGSCSSGLCQVTGGTAAGSNLFHRFSSFDTRGAISGVQILNGAFANVVVGVTAPLGSFIDKPVSLSTPGSLVWLSPGGLAVSGAGGFVNTTQLTLSTATNQRIGEGRFEVFGTTPQQAALLTGQPGTAAADLVLDPAVRALAGMEPDPEIVLQGIRLTVDRDLLVDNSGGLVSVAGSTLSASSTSGTGGSITLTGRDVWIDGLSSLLATGPAGGGLVQVGGSWQNNDSSVRQAVRTWIGSGALLDASATVNGNGGTVVAWSDITNPLGSTIVSGTLLAKGGLDSGDGGRIETSGYGLAMPGIVIDTSAASGRHGLWLLDPADIQIYNATPSIFVSTSGNITTYSAPVNAGSGSVNVADLQNAMSATNVVVTTAGSGQGQGQITVSAPINLNTITSLTLIANADILLDADFAQNGSGSLILQAGGEVKGTGNLSLNGGSVTVQTGNVNSGDYGGVISGTNTSLIKQGVGEFRLTNAQTYTGITDIQSGKLTLSSNNTSGSLADAGAVLVSQGATFNIWKSAPETIGSLAGGGTVDLAVIQDGLVVGSASTSTTFSGQITGRGFLTKVGGGSLILSGNNTYTGLTTINGGMLQFAQKTSLYDGISSSWTANNIKVSNGSTLALNTGGAGEFGEADLTTVLENLGAQGGVVTNNGFLAGSRIGLDTTNASIPQGGVFGKMVFNGVIADSIGTGGGSIGLLKLGSGTLVLRGQNTYTGGTTVAAGGQLAAGEYTVAVNDVGSLSTSFGTGLIAVQSGGELNLVGRMIDNSVSLAGNGLGLGGGFFTGALSNNDPSNPNNFSGGFSSADLRGLVTLNPSGAAVRGAYAMTISGSISGQGALTVMGSQVYLNGANTYSGGTSVVEGALRALNSSAFGTGLVAILPGAAVELEGGISLDNNFTSMGTGVGLGGALRNISGTNIITGSIELQHSSNLFTSVSGSLVFDRPGSTSSAVVVAGAFSGLDFVLGGAGNFVFSDSINLSYLLQGVTTYGNLVKNDSGTVFLDAANQLGATLSVNGGTLAYSNVDFFGGAAQASRTLIVDGGVLRSQISHQTHNTNGSSTFLLGANGGTWQVDPGFAVTFAGSMSGSGSFTKAGTGLLTLTGANGYQGATSISGGTLLVSGSLPEGTALTVSSGAVYGLGIDSTVGSIAGSGDIDLGSYTLTAGGDGSSTTFAGAISGSGGLSKAGGGELTLSGASSYGGATIVTGGTLTVNQQPPSKALCLGGSSNICSNNSTPAQVQELLTPSISVVPGFSISTTTTAPPITLTTASFSTSTTSVSTSSAKLTGGITTAGDFQPASTLPANGTTLISNANVSILNFQESSFSIAEVGGTASASGSASASPSSSASSNADSASSNNGKDDSGSSDKQEGSQQSIGTEVSQVTDGSSLGPPPTVIVPAQEAAASSQQSDLKSGQQALSTLAPERDSSALVAPSVPQMQQSLSNATSQVRNGGLGSQSGLPRPGIGADGWLLATAAGPLPASSDAGRAALLPLVFNRAAYTPAVLHVRFSEARGGTVRPDTDAFLDLTLVPMQGEVEGRRVEVSKQDFAALLKQLYTQLSRQDSLNNSNPSAPARRLHELLIGPIAPVLAKRGITTLLISADRGLQAVPFAALHDGQRYFGDAYAFSLTPSLALTSLTLPQAGQGRLLAAGAAVFDGLAPLPLVPSELDQVGRPEAKDMALNRSFTPSTLLEQAADPRYSRVHVATHAEFLPGGPAASRLYSGTVPIPLSDFVKLRRARQGLPLDLISFSACRTALGDADSELGFAGLALQVGARSAVGTLWYVDDVATSAYFVQMYRYLEAGIPKAEALQLTRQAFSRGLVRLEGDQLLGPEGRALLTGLTGSQQRRVTGGLQNPYFWAGVELLGSAW